MQRSPVLRFCSSCGGFCALPWSARLREASGYNEKTFLDAADALHADELRTIERIRRIGPTELEDVITIYDPTQEAIICPFETRYDAV